MNLFSHSGIDIDPRPFVLLDVYHHFSEIIALGLMAYQRLKIFGERRSSESDVLALLDPWVMACPCPARPVGDGLSLPCSPLLTIAPVPVEQPELHAFQAVTKTLRWLDTELATLALSTSWRGVLASGFVEIVACEGPLDCFPMGEVSFRASEQLERLPFAQLACDMPSFQTLFNQAPELIADLGLQPDDSPAPLNPDALVVLLDGNQTASVPASQLARLQPRSWVQSASSASQFGALLLALIAAPCAAMVVLAPGALLIGLGSLMAAALPLWKVVGMSLWPRVLITLLAVTLASLNWIRIELVQRRFRRLQQQVGGQLQLPRLQRRRLRLVRCSSITVLAVVLLEGILRVMVMKMPLL